MIRLDKVDDEMMGPHIVVSIDNWTAHWRSHQSSPPFAHSFQSFEKLASHREGASQAPV